MPFPFSVFLSQSLKTPFTKVQSVDHFVQLWDKFQGRELRLSRKSLDTVLKLSWTCFCRPTQQKICVDSSSKYQLIQILAEYKYDIILVKYIQYQLIQILAAHSLVTNILQLTFAKLYYAASTQRSETVKCKVSALSAMRNKCISTPWCNITSAICKSIPE